MLNEIRTPEAVALAGPVALLLDCHHRILHFVGMAVRLAENPTAAHDEICGAAEAIVRFFTVAFRCTRPMKTNRFLPVCAIRSPPADIVAKSVETMVSQHRAIDELLQSIIPLWQAVQSQPVELIELAPELKKLTNRLRLHLAAHLAMEEDVIFPALEKLLPAAERQAHRAGNARPAKPGKPVVKRGRIFRPAVRSSRIGNREIRSGGAYMTYRH